MFKKFFVEFVLDETQIFQKGLFITLKKPNMHVFPFRHPTLCERGLTASSILSTYEHTVLSDLQWWEFLSNTRQSHKGRKNPRKRRKN